MFVLLHCLAVCNSVEVVHGNYEYTSSDEIAYVQMCALMGCKLIQSSGSSKTVRLGSKKQRHTEVVTVLQVEPFTSSSKVDHVRMHTHVQLRTHAGKRTFMHTCTRMHIDMYAAENGIVL